MSDLRVGVLKISFKGNPAVAAYAEFPAKVAVDDEGQDLAWIDAPIPHRVHAVRRVAKEAYGEYSDEYGDTLSVFPCGQPCVATGMHPAYFAGQSGSPRIQGDTLVGLVVGVLEESTGVHIGGATVMPFLKRIGKCPDAIDGEDK